MNCIRFGLTKPVEFVLAFDKRIASQLVHKPRDFVAHLLRQLLYLSTLRGLHNLVWPSRPAGFRGFSVVVGEVIEGAGELGELALVVELVEDVVDVGGGAVEADFVLHPGLDFLGGGDAEVVEGVEDGAAKEGAAAFAGVAGDEEAGAGDVAGVGAGEGPEVFGAGFDGAQSGGLWAGEALEEGVGGVCGAGWVEVGVKLVEEVLNLGGAQADMMTVEVEALADDECKGSGEKILADGGLRVAERRDGIHHVA